MYVIKKIVIMCDEWMEVCWVVYFLVRFNLRYVKENSLIDVRFMDKICFEFGIFVVNFGYVCFYVIFFLELCECN